jgi:hypothetical protein
MADENKEINEQQNQPEEKTVTLTEKELEQRFTNKFAEGAKREAKRLFDELGVTNLDDLKTKLENPEVKAELERLKKVEDDYSKTAVELSQLKAERVAIKLGATAEIAENVVALVKGKGQDLTEENVKSALEFFQKNAQKGFGTLPKGRETESKIKKIPTVF